VADIESSLVAHMLDQSSITDYVGTKIREFEKNPEDAEPYIVVVPISNPRGPWTRTKYGGVARLTIYVYATTRSAARTIGETILDTYKQFHGTMEDHTVEYTEVSSARTFTGDDRYTIDLIVHYH
jgi:hypothetical protein